MHIPGYRIIRKINQGGMATVYLAIQTSVGRVVALKVMSPSLDGDPTFSERFQVEANIVGQLSHPHIVAIYDIGHHEKLNYIAMDYLPDGSIHDKMLTGISQDLALLILKDIASALDHAHEKGYVHRDIKPENILFRDENYAVLTDFGVARANTSNIRKTLAGTVVGTPHYMSPEQTRGKTVDARSDLYSLGIVFYEMLTGSVPYKGDEPVTIALKHLAAPIPTLPMQYITFQPLVNKLLAKDPNERFQQGRDLVAEIESIEFQIRNKSGLYGTDEITLAEQFIVLFKVLFRKVRAKIKRQSHHIYFYVKSFRWTKEEGFHRKLPKTISIEDDLTQQNTLIATRINQQLGQELTLWEKFNLSKYRNHIIAISIITLGLLLLIFLPTPAADLKDEVASEVVVQAAPQEPALTVRTTPAPTESPIEQVSDTETIEIPAENFATTNTEAAIEPAVNTTSIEVSLNEIQDSNANVDALISETAEAPVAEETPVDILPADITITPDSEPFLAVVPDESDIILESVVDINPVIAAELELEQELQPKPEQENIKPVIEKTYKFTVLTTPSDARVRILNIRDKYKPGMALLPGRYRLEVTQSGFQKYLRWVTLGKRNLRHKVKLKPVYIAGNVFRHTLNTGVTGPSMVIIPQGSFTMGGIEANSRPKHKVTFKNRIAVSRHEITFDNYEAFAKTKSMPLPGDNRWGRGDRPVINISWEEANLYTHWLSEQSGHTYRLPSEAEWEYIAKSGQVKAPETGVKKLANCRRGCRSEYSGIFKSKSAPVGQFKANAFGVYDTAGNVAEWVADCYQPSYNGVASTGVVVEQTNCSTRVVRGGSMLSKVAETEPDRRSSQPQHTLHKNIGFRVVVELQ